MAITKLNLQPITTESDYSNITIGNSKFTDDVWDLSEFISGKTISQKFKEINFKYIENNAMKEVIKLYAYYKLSECKPQTVRNKINSSLPSFINYCNDRAINSFEQVNKTIFLEYAMWLKEEKKVSRITGYSSCNVVEEIIKTAQLKNICSTDKNLFINMSSSDLWDIQKTIKQNKTKPIPEDIFDKILQCALKEKNILTSI